MATDMIYGVACPMLSFSPLFLLWYPIPIITIRECDSQRGVSVVRGEDNAGGGIYMMHKRWSMLMCLAILHLANAQLLGPLWNKGFTKKWNGKNVGMKCPNT